MAAWAEVQHGSSRLDGNGNAALARLSGNATLVGADLQLDGGWRLGALGGTGRSDIAISERSSKAEVDGKHLGVHASQQWDGFGVRAGLAQSWQSLKTHRNVAVPGMHGNADAKYDATTRQAFVEAGYRFDFGRTGLEPFAQYAQVRVKSDAAREAGGLPALSLAGETFKTNLSVAGVRFNADLAGNGQAQRWLSLRGSLAYQHAGGDRFPVANAAWSGGGNFAVVGTPLARNAVLTELGVAARLSANSLLELGYTGTQADEGHDSGVNARFSVQF